MKNQYLSIFLVIFLSACQVDNHNILPTLQEANYVEKTDDFWANMRLRNYKNGKSFHYNTKSAASLREQKNELAVVLGLELTKNQFELPWEYLNEIAQKYFDKEGINPINYSADYGVSLQFAALEIAHRAALKASPSSERNQALEYYMDILIAQKGVDCDAMAELAIELKNIVSPGKYNDYRQYVINLAKEELEVSMLKLDEYRKEIETNEANSSESSIFQAELARYIDKYLSAKDALERLRGG
jgi:hypothetical protein